MIRQFVRDLQNALGQQSLNKSLQLGKGQCASMEQYKHTSGYIAGLDAAADIADKMLRAVEDAERQQNLPPMPNDPPEPPQKKAAGGKK